MHKVHSFVSFKVATRISNFQDCVWEVVNQKETVTQRKSPRKLPTKKKEIEYVAEWNIKFTGRKKIKISFFLKTKKESTKGYTIYPGGIPHKSGEKPHQAVVLCEKLLYSHLV